MKKLLALCLTVVLVLAMVPIIGASAAGSATFSVSDATAAPGEEVTVTVSIDDNPGLTFAQIMVGYDSSVFELVNIEKLTFAGKSTSCSPLTANPLKVTYDNCLEDIYDTGALANVTFKVKEDAADGDYTLEVSADQENVFNVNFEDVPFTTVDGTVTVESATVTPPAVDGLTFIAGNATGNPGDEVTVPVSIAGNPGITFAQIMVGYDSSVLELVNIEKLTFAGKSTSCSPLTANPLKVTYDNCLEDIYDNGDLANVTFKIKDSAAAGDYTLEVSAEQDNVFNVAFEDVLFSVINGTITVAGGSGDGSCAHNWVEKVDDKYLVIEATCTSKALYSKSCELCGEVSDEAFEAGEVLPHTWVEVVDDKYLATEATCTAKATYYKSCSVCKAAGEETFENGDVLPHTAAQVVDEKYLATEATCTDKATYYTSCSVCGEKLDATFPSGELAAHTYGEWNTTKEPTETETGIKEKVCSVCGDKVTEEIPVLPPVGCTHDWVEVVDGKYLATEATCTAKATYYKSCSVCKAAGEETFEAGELAEHTAAQVVDSKYLATEATCENKATYYTSCSVCGEKLDATFEAGELADHTYGAWIVTKEPTETETGLKEKVCSVCGDKVTEVLPVVTTPSGEEVVFAVGEVIGAPGEEVTVEVSINKNPGITFAQVMVGYDAEALEVVAITPVTFAGIDASFGPSTANPIKITWENNLENITETGVIATVTFKIKDSAVAGDYALSVNADPDYVLDTATNNVPFAVVDGTIKVHNHDWVEVVDDKYLATEATCTAKATYYKSCSVCGKATDATFESGDVLPHTAAQVVDEKYLATEATCVDKATYFTSCSVCGAKLDATFEAGEVLAHTWAEVVDEKYLVSEATCTAKAVYNKSCSECGAAGTETFEAGEVLAHTWAEVVDEKYLVSAATCEAKAVYNKSCSACGEANDETFEAGELAAHDLKENAAVDATCDAAGSIANWSCSVCEKIFKDAEAKEEITAEDLVVEELEHKYGDWKVVKEATTTEKGSKEKVCELCGEKVTEEIPELPEKPAGDDNQTSPPTNDVNIFVVVSMIMALAAAAVVVLKKKA